MLLIVRPGDCPARGATVDFYDQTAGGILVHSGSTGPTGSISYVDSTPGHVYDISWAFEDQSGTETDVPACSTRTVNITNPPGYTSNCPDPLPDLFCTDACGTYQIWPTFTCYPGGPAGALLHFQGFLVAGGTCAIPFWTLNHVAYFDSGCTSVQSGRQPVAVNINCQGGPIFFSGTYPSLGGELYLPGQPFNIHQ